MPNNPITTESYVSLINQELESYLNADRISDNIVSQAMRYSVGNGGKRIRPILALEFCRACGGDFKKALPFACAVELIHCYSLIHDDLPCMDNDDLRRGIPSCHIQFGEEYALLAGDALLTLAFEILLDADLEPAAIIQAGKQLAKYAGNQGMIGGQVLDLQSEGKTVTIDTLKEMDTLKTGALITCAAVLGCIAGNADAKQLEAAKYYAACLGLSFQIVDDILDITSSTEVLGKPVGSDRENQKSNYVSLLGLETSRTLVSELTQHAIQSLAPFGENTQFLITLAQELENRQK